KEWRMAQMTAASSPHRTVATLQDKKREEIISAYMFVTPALIAFLIFLVIPIVFAFYISFTNWNGITPLNSAHPYDFIGLNNYNQLLLQPGIHQTDFYTSLKNTIYY